MSWIYEDFDISYFLYNAFVIKADSLGIKKKSDVEWCICLEKLPIPGSYA